jgi:hypothetical protein
MPEGTGRAATPGQPVLAWRTLTDAPLVGFRLAREAGLLLVWDEARSLLLLDAAGERLGSVRAPAPVLSADLSDDGALIAVLAGGPRLLLLDEELAPLADRPAPAGATVLTVDPHGRYLVVATRSGENHLYSRHGKPAGRFTTRQPLTHVRFIAGEPRIICGSGYGFVAALDLRPARSPGTLEAEPVWEERLLSNLGRLEVSGDGGMVLASCYNVGVQRYDRSGHNEGSYHLGGTALHAIPDFPGRSIAVATQEGDVGLLNRAGNVRWKTGLGRAPVALEFDALGRHLTYGLATGEIARVEFESGSSASSRRAAAGRPGVARGSTIREPEWTVAIARDSDEGQATVVAVLDEPARIGAMTRGNRLRVFDPRGNELGPCPEIRGIGRFLRTAPGWIAAATDRQILLYDARRDAAQSPDLDLVQVTHLITRPDSFGLAILQERDRAGRATVAGRWVWKRDLRSPAEDMAVGPLSLTALSTDDGVLLVLDAAGEPIGRFEPNPPEPLLLVEGFDGAGAGGPTWITLARRAQVLRGHAPDGGVLWESPTPFEGWALARVGTQVVVTAPDGRALAFDAQGYLRAQGGPEPSPFVLIPGPGDEIWRIIRKDVHLICADLSGQVRWRSVGEQPWGPAAGGRAGVAAVQGSALVWFPSVRRG